MRRVLEMGEHMHCGQAQRLLVIETDTDEELDGLVSTASKKGWTLYAQGTVPETGWLGAWMLKPADSSDEQPKKTPA